MAKSVQITAQIEDWIRSATANSDFDTSKVSVFETYLVSTRPIQKRGSIFNDARIVPSVLVAMAEHINQEGHAIPLHTLHQQGGELPVGRVIYATTEELNDGETALRGLFYIDNAEEDLVAKVNTGTIDEVSIGLSTQQILCSECGWDYKGPDADFMNLMEQTCANGHTIGENGTHARLVGFDRWLETSLVSVGASQNSKIVSRAKQRLGQEERERLAANGLVPEATILIANSNLMEEPMANGNGGGNGNEPTALNLNGLIDQLSELKAQTTAFKAEVETLKAAATQKDEQIATLTSERDTLKQQLEAANGDNAETFKTQLDAANATLGQAQEKLREHATAALTAAGQTNVDLSEKTAEELLAAIDESGLKLHQLAGQTGQAHDAASGDTEQGKPKALAAAFTTRK